MKTVNRESSRVLDKLKDIGLLLMTDARLPSVATLIAGEPVRGSWWGHPRAHNIFAALGQLADHKDVLFTRLISGKVTLIHRRLWPDLVSIAVSNERWQTHGLSTATKYLWRLVEGKGAAPSDGIAWPKRFQSFKIGDAIRDLEARLLIHTEEFHTESGAHAKVLETWHHWAERNRLKLDSRVPTESQHVFETLLKGLNEEYGGRSHLPWQTALLQKSDPRARGVKT